MYFYHFPGGGWIKIQLKFICEFYFTIIKFNIRNIMVQQQQQ